MADKDRGKKSPLKRPKLTQAEKRARKAERGARQQSKQSDIQSRFLHQ
jgi:hypothetical protein